MTQESCFSCVGPPRSNASCLVDTALRQGDPLSLSPLFVQSYIAHRAYLVHQIIVLYRRIGVN
jgi:hypothetical protein